MPIILPNLPMITCSESWGYRIVGLWGTGICSSPALMIFVSCILASKAVLCSSP